MVEWEMVTIGDIIIGNPSYGINAPACAYAVGLPQYIRITDITEQGYYSKDDTAFVDDANSGNYYLEENDIVLARTGASVGKSYLYNKRDGKLVYAGFLIKISVDTKKASAKYIFECLHTKLYRDWVQTTSMRSGQPGINGKQYASFDIILPPLPEQRAIAAALSDADAYITTLEKLIAKKRNLKQGAMQELLTGKRRLPGFEDEWLENTYRRLCEFINGRAYAQDELLSEGPYRVLRLGNFFTNNHWYYSNLELPDKQYCDSGDLLYAWSASFGPVLWSGEKVIYHYHIWKTVVSPSVTKDFLYHYMFFDTQSIMGELQGGTMSHLTKAAMESRMCTYPSNKDEQTAIANILSDMDAEIDALTAKLEKAQRIKQGMMSELLTGRIRLIQEDTDNGEN